jgi:hypothetical protein
MDIIQEAKNLMLQEVKKYGGLDFKIVEEKALELAKKMNADKKIVLLGIYLMDIKAPEAFSQGRMSEHVRMGIETTKKFLKKFNLNEEIKKKIINCVEAHHKDVPFICKEAEICANADCYRFLHPKGFLKALIFLGKDLELEKVLDILEQRVEEKYRILSLNICKKELGKYYHLLKEIIKSTK